MERKSQADIDIIADEVMDGFEVSGKIHNATIDITEHIRVPFWVAKYELTPNGKRMLIARCQEICDEKLHEYFEEQSDEIQ